MESNGSIHQFSQTLANRESKTGALVSFGGRVCEPRKWGEEGAHGGLGDTDARVHHFSGNHIQIGVSVVDGKTGVDLYVAILVNLTALLTRFCRTWRNRRGSPLKFKGKSGSMVV